MDRNETNEMKSAKVVKGRQVVRTETRHSIEMAQRKDTGSWRNETGNEGKKLNKSSGTRNKNKAPGNAAKGGRKEEKDGRRGKQMQEMREKKRQRK